MTRASPFEVDLEAINALPEAEREEELANVAALNRILEENPLWRYVPHDGDQGVTNRGQVEYHEADQPVVALLGGNRSGKSYGSIADDILQAVDADALPPWLAPYKRWEEFYCRIVTADLVSTLEGVILPLIRKLVPKAQLFKGSWEKAYDGRRRRLQFANGNWFDFLTHTMELDQFSGAALHRVHFDEEPPGNKGKDIYNESLVRLIDFGGEVRFSLTPLLGLSWLYHEVTTQGIPRQDEEVHTIVVDMDHNPHLDPKAKARTLAGYSPEERAARKSGRFVHFAGTVYHEFDRSRHVIPGADIPRDEAGAPSVLIHCGIDPGTDHPAAVVWTWLDDDDVMTVFASFKVRHSTVADVAKRIHGINEEMGIKPRWYVIDPSARNKHHITGRSLQMEYADHGIHAIPGQNARVAGFNRVKERLRPTGVNEEPLPPRLYIMASNEELIEEFNDYRWKSPPATESVGKEDVVKVKDDLLDALRYVIMSRPAAPGKAPDPEADVSPGQRAFFDSLKRLGRGRRKRVGGYV